MTEAQKLFARLRKATLNCFTIPNDKLPEAYRNTKSDRVVLASLEKKADKLEGITQHQKDQAVKARNIARLAAQVGAKSDIDGPLDWSQNELADWRGNHAKLETLAISMSDVQDNQE